MSLLEITQYCGKLITKACTHYWSKIVASGILVILSFFFDSAQKEAMLALFVLVILDFISAIFAAVKTGECIKSSKIFRTAIKLVVYFIIIAAAYKTESTVPLSFLDETVIGFLTVTELISLLENFGKAGYAVPTILIDKLKDFKDKK